VVNAQCDASKTAGQLQSQLCPLKWEGNFACQDVTSPSPLTLHDTWNRFCITFVWCICCLCWHG